MDKLFRGLSFQGVQRNSRCPECVDIMHVEFVVALSFRRGQATSGRGSVSHLGKIPPC